MVYITRNTKYTARARQNPDFSKKILGYDFSYPVLNTIDIANLLMVGGSKEIQIERMGKPKWSYDINTHILSVQQNNHEDTHTICNPEELGNAMIQYFEKNGQAIADENYAVSMKKSASKIGNKNAKKELKACAITPSQKIITDIEQSTVGTNDGVNNDEYPTDFLNNMPKFLKATKDNQFDFCSLYDFLQLPRKTIAEYFYWVVGNGWLELLNQNICNDFEKAGFNMKLAFKHEYNIRNYMKAKLDNL